MTKMTTTLYHGDIAARVLVYAASQSTSLIQGTQLLRVLPAAEQPDTRKAILARGFVDPALAIALGHANLLAEFQKWRLLDARHDIVPALANSGDVAALSAFVTHHCVAIEHGPMAIDALDINTIVNAVLESGHVLVLEWFVAFATERKEKLDWYQGTWIAAAAGGHISVLSWALAQKYLDINEFTLETEAAAKAVQVGVLEWIHDQKQIQVLSYSAAESGDIAFAASKSKETRALEWWWTNVASTFSSPLPSPFIMRGIVDEALSRGKLEAVRWWWAKFLAHRTPEHRFGSSDAAPCALASGSLPLLEWLWSTTALRPDATDLFIDWTARLSIAMPEEKFSASLPLIHWWIKTQLPPGEHLTWTPAHAVECVQSGAVDVLDWVLTSLEPTSDVTWGKSIAATALQYGHLPVLEWLGKHYNDLPQQRHPEQGFFAPGLSDWDGTGAVDWWESNVGFSDAAFARLGADIAGECDRDWLEWWLTHLSKPSRRRVVPSALTRALVSAQLAWVLDMLASDAAARYGLAVESLVADHTCMRRASSVEAVCWWFIVLGGDDVEENKWRSQRNGDSLRCAACWT
ncbi:hypothetical protein BC828DRAFT_390312, partial [Blastocladiella britannica]